MDKNKIGIVTVNWNHADDTLAFLKSLKELKLPKDCDIEVIIVDNGSEDDSVEKIKGVAGVSLIKTGQNLGFSGGYNRGIQEAIDKGYKYCLIVNNDAFIEDPLILQKMLEIADRRPSLGVIVPKIHFAPGFEFHKEKYSKGDIGKVIWYAGGYFDWANMFSKHRGVDEVDTGQYDKVEEIEFGTGCCMFFNLENMKQVGFFDDKLFAYTEDADLSIRIKNKGLKIIYAGNTSLWHKSAQSSAGSGSPFHDYFIIRNRLIVGMRYAPFRTKFALLREAIRLFFSDRPFMKLAVKDFFTGNFGKGSFFENYKK